jgi:hypothetical protein
MDDEVRQRRLTVVMERERITILHRDIEDAGGRDRVQHRGGLGSIRAAFASLSLLEAPPPRMGTPEMLEPLAADLHTLAVRIGNILESRSMLGISTSAALAPRTRSGACTTASATRPRLGATHAGSWPRSNGTRANSIPEWASWSRTWVVRPTAGNIPINLLESRRRTSSRPGLRTPTALPHVDGFPVLAVLRRLRRPAPRGALGDPTFSWCWTCRARLRLGASFAPLNPFGYIPRRLRRKSRP